MSKSLSLPVVEAIRLQKSFGRVRALDEFDLTVGPGEVHGFLGPNGAGKSTTIRALLGQLRLDGGELRVFGLDARRDAVAVHRRLTYVPGDTALWPTLTGGECIDLLGRFQGGQVRARRDLLVDRFELDPTRRARTYSKGNRQKVALIAALSNDVELYVLDEPTSGLDPIMEARFQETITEIRDAGRTVLLSSHILDEVEALCDRVTIIREGRAVSTGTLDELRAHTMTTVTASTESAITGLERWPALRDIERSMSAGLHHLSVDCPRTDLPDVVTHIAARRPINLAVRPPTLDQLFLQHYQADADASVSIS